MSACPAKQSLFGAEVSCAADYVGKPVVSACSKPLTTYSVSGCRPMKCIAPTAEAKKDYVVKETSLEKPTFGVSATCLKGGMAGEVVPCIFDGEPYTLKGCDEASCESPHRTQETGYTVHPGCRKERGPGSLPLLVGKQSRQRRDVEIHWRDQGTRRTGTSDPSRSLPIAPQDSWDLGWSTAARSPENLSPSRAASRRLAKLPSESRRRITILRSLPWISRPSKWA